MWYLANDMQFFLITPLLLFFYCKMRIAGYLCIGAIMVTSASLTAWWTAEGNDIKDWYDKPWERVVAYMQGILLGLMYFEYKCK